MICLRSNNYYKNSTFPDIFKYYANITFFFLKGKIYHNYQQIIIYSVLHILVMKTKRELRQTWEICPRLLIESKYYFQERHFTDFREKSLYFKNGKRGIIENKGA